MNNTQAMFEREKRRFSASTERAKVVSKAGAGRQGDMPTVMSSYVFTRLCVGAETLRYLLERTIGNSSDLTLDHYSISVLARNVVEGALMFFYLSEDGVTDDEWALRGRVLDLHDAVLKLRLFKSINATAEYEAFKQDTDWLRGQMRQLPAFQKLELQRQEKLLSGQELYVGGLRSTLRLAGFTSEYFDGMYAYLSQHVHISSSSFYRTDNRLRFASPSSYQFYFSAYAVAHARMFLVRAAVRLASVPIVNAKVAPAVLKSMDKLASIKFGD
jgi:hypothetical protein